MSMLAAIAMTAFALGVASAGPQAQHPSIKIKVQKTGLLAQARISGDSAYALARARVPAGGATEGELEVEDGRLVYSFDLRVSGKTGVEEVLVDAKSGQIVSVEHETPKAEAKESKKPHGA